MIVVIHAIMPYALPLLLLHHALPCLDMPCHASPCPTVPRRQGLAGLGEARPDKARLNSARPGQQSQSPLCAQRDLAGTLFTLGSGL